MKTKRITHVISQGYSNTFKINYSIFGIFDDLHVINDNILKYLNNDC